MKIKRGDIFYAELGKGKGSEQNGERPVLIIQNNVGNTYSPTTIIACLTTQFTKAKLPTHVHIGRGDSTEHNQRFVDSLVLCEQVRTIDKSRLKDRIARLTDGAMTRVDKALLVSVFEKE